MKRYDSAPVKTFQRTGSGGLRLDAALTRTGVFSYRQPDGSTRREYRPEAEVFKADALESFSGLPVTVGHPGVVTPENWRQVAVGHVSDGVRRDGAFVASRVVVNDQKTIEAIESGDLVEISCGYDVDLVETPGEHDGERYDAIQTNIRGNHVALGPKGWGRAGPDVRLRLDGDQEAANDQDAEPKLTRMAQDPQAPQAIDAKNVEIRVDGAKEIEKLSAQNEMLQAKVKDLETKLATANDPKRVDSLVAERVALLAQAQKLVKEDLSAKSPREIRIAAITAAKPDFKADGKSDDFVAAAFEFALSFETAKPTPALGALRADAHNAGPSEDPIEAAKKKMQERNAKAWTK